MGASRWSRWQPEDVCSVVSIVRRCADSLHLVSPAVHSWLLPRCCNVHLQQYFWTPAIVDPLSREKWPTHVHKLVHGAVHRNRPVCEHTRGCMLQQQTLFLHENSLLERSDQGMHCGGRLGSYRHARPPSCYRHFLKPLPLLPWTPSPRPCIAGASYECRTRARSLSECPQRARQMAGAFGNRRLGANVAAGIRNRETVMHEQKIQQCAGYAWFAGAAQEYRPS